MIFPGGKEWHYGKKKEILLKGIPPFKIRFYFKGKNSGKLYEFTVRIGKQDKYNEGRLHVEYKRSL